MTRPSGGGAAGDFGSHRFAGGAVARFGRAGGPRMLGRGWRGLPRFSAIIDRAGRARTRVSRGRPRNLVDRACRHCPAVRRGHRYRAPAPGCSAPNPGHRRALQTPGRTPPDAAALRRGATGVGGPPPRPGSTTFNHGSMHDHPLRRILGFAGIPTGRLSPWHGRVYFERKLLIVVRVSGKSYDVS